jgi:hypothetical protein
MESSGRRRDIFPFTEPERFSALIKSCRKLFNEPKALLISIRVRSKLPVVMKDFSFDFPRRQSPEI